MGHRLSKIYTRTGDSGETGLGDGSRTRKDGLRVVALGEIDELNSAIGVLLAEPLPGGTRAAGLAHLASAVCSRAERSLVALSQAEKVADPPRVYLNRLSDLLFVLARVLNREGGRGDVLWQQGKNR